jgi:hypothetical protein
MCKVRHVQGAKAPMCKVRHVQGAKAPMCKVRHVQGAKAPMCKAPCARCQGAHVQGAKGKACLGHGLWKSLPVFRICKQFRLVLKMLLEMCVDQCGSSLVCLQGFNPLW